MQLTNLPYLRQPETHRRNPLLFWKKDTKCQSSLLKYSALRGVITFLFASSHRLLEEWERKISSLENLETFSWLGYFQAQKSVPDQDQNKPGWPEGNHVRPKQMLNRCLCGDFVLENRGRGSEAVRPGKSSGRWAKWKARKKSVNE